jgi:hypothetical protein
VRKFYCVLCRRYGWGKPVGRTSDGEYCRRYASTDNPACRGRTGAPVRVSPGGFLRSALRIRWTARLGDVHPDNQLTVARTIRARLLALPGRLVNRSRRLVLRLPARWPWAATFHHALDQIRSLPLIT